MQKEELRTCGANSADTFFRSDSCLVVTCYRYKHGIVWQCVIAFYDFVPAIQNVQSSIVTQTTNRIWGGLFVFCGTFLSQMRWNMGLNTATWTAWQDRTRSRSRSCEQTNRSRSPSLSDLVLSSEPTDGLLAGECCVRVYIDIAYYCMIDWVMKWIWCVQFYALAVEYKYLRKPASRRTMKAWLPDLNSSLKYRNVPLLGATCGIRSLRNANPYCL